ncbi:hypothetical protein GGR53DRAFT_494550 [Hypoxylon sp. FL1150]|nr:hypothetical protein GGR53DRAFT_494550 [Hypoxylon sp. FL1150]
MMAVITDLPNELIQLVAGRCPVPDTIALSQTCRRLRQACDNAAVFQMSCKLHLPDVISAAFKDKNALVRFMAGYVDGPKKPCQRHESSKMTWLCLAVAIHRLPEVPAELTRLSSSVDIHAALKPPQMGEDTKEALQGVLAFLSTLPIWGCAEACDPKVAALLDRMCPLLLSQSPDLKSLRIDQSLGGEHPLQFAFSLVMCNLKRRQPIKTYDLIGDPRSVFIPSTSQLHTIVKYNYNGRTMGPEYDKFQGSWIGKQTHALLLMTLMCRHVYHVLTATISTHLPNPNKIEFISPWYFAGGKGKYDEYAAGTGTTSLRPRFPLLTPNLIAPQSGKGRYFYPFAGDEWWSWYTTRVRDLVRRLDEGEWYGTYISNLHLGGRVDSPMQGICFRRTATNGDTYSIEALDCIDGRGKFTLSGEVDASDVECRIRFQKRYPSRGLHWDLDGLVTPLGICGRWNRPGDHGIRSAGYFWLWKREWADCDEDVV